MKIGKHTFRHVQEFVEKIVLVSDDEIKRYASGKTLLSGHFPVIVSYMLLCSQLC